jgi:hypothetical protein
LGFCAFRNGLGERTHVKPDNWNLIPLSDRTRERQQFQPDISLQRLAGAGELSLAVESRGIIDQNGLAQGRVRNPRRQQVKEMAVVNPKRWRYRAAERPGGQRSHCSYPVARKGLLSELRGT